jgi:zinc transport system substrate-binding protein
MFSRIVLLLAAPAMAMLAGCGTSEASRPVVVAAFYPVAFAVQQVAGDEVDVVNLTPPGVEPHDLELTPRQVGEIARAELVVHVGGGFQPGVEDAVAAREGPSLDLRPAPGRGDPDPHVWLDPDAFAAAVERIGAALERPEAAGDLAGRLRALDADFREGLADCERHEIVTSHAAFGHLARRYGLEQVALTGIQPEAEPTAKAVERLVAQVRASGATTVFSEPLLSSRLARTVAREAGVRAAVLDPLEGLTEDAAASGADYFTVMRKNLAALREALTCR